MNRYRVFGEVQSYSILPPHVKLNMAVNTNQGNLNLIISNINAIDLIGREFSKRLSIVAEVEADDILSAVSKCNYFSEQILDKIALEVGMPVEEFKIDKAFQLAGETEDIELVKFDYDIIDKIGSKVLNPARLQSIEKSSSNDRIIRAMHWYRKALNETDLLDIFSYLWISLETLNSLLKEKYPDAYIISKCANCDVETRRVDTAPLKMFFQEVLDNVELYSKARKIRQSIFHGFKDIGVIQEQLIEIIDDLEVACRKAIFYLLDIDDSVLGESGLGNNEGFTFVSFLKIRGFISDDSSPQYFVPDINVEIEMTEYNNELVIKPIIKTDIFNHGCALAGLGWEMWGGNPGYPIRKIQFQIRG